MRIPSGTTDQYLYFVAVDSTDLKTRETGLSSFTVYRSRNGAAAAAFTTPTVNEVDATNMPGVYELLLDEDMTIAAGNDSEEMVVHITHAGMAPVTRAFELYRRAVTSGNTLGVASDGDISGNVDGSVASVSGAVGSVTGNVGGNVTGSVGSISGVTFPTNFADLAITVTTGQVTVGTNNDKTGYSISGTLTTLDALDTAQDSQHATTQAAVSGLNDPTAAAIADAVWDEAQSGHTTAGTFGKYLDTEVSGVGGGGGDATAANQTTIIGHLTDIKGGTFSGTTDSLEAIRDRGDAAWLTATGFSTHSAADVRTEIDANSTQLAAILTDTGTTLPATLTTIEGKIDTVDTVADAILVDTGTTIPGTLSTLATSAALATVDSNVAAILVDTGTTIPATITTLQGDVTAILTDTGTTLPAQISGLNDPTAAAIADAVWDEAQAGHTTAGTFGKYLDTEISGVTAPTAAAVADAVWTEAIADHSGTAGSTAEALANASAPTAAAVADAVWDEAIAGHVSAGTTGAKLNSLATGAGSGARTVTVTVDDGTTALENATVRYTEGGNTYTASTDVNGQATFNLDDATYTVAIQKSGYSYSGTTHAISADDAATYSMSAITIPSAPSDSTLCRVYGYFEDLNNVASEGVEIEFQLIAPDPTKANKIIVGRTIKGTTDSSGNLTDANGNLYIDLQRNDNLTPSNTYYWVNAPALKMKNLKMTLEAATYDLSSLIT